ncbi:MAG: hypothetical protein AAF378_24310 [Cyanobacteria bacterium P01_A01_bin.84]
MFSTLLGLLGFSQRKKEKLFPEKFLHKQKYEKEKGGDWKKAIDSISYFIATRIFNISNAIASNPRLGKIAFNSLETMYLGKPDVIEVKITDNPSEEIKIEEKGEIVTENIDIYHSMKAEITGTGFEIKRLTEENQIVLEDKIVTWRWAIIPNKLGKQKLYLNVYAIFQVGTAREPLNLSTFERVIKVKVSPRLTLIENWLRLSLWIIPGGAITTFISKSIIDYLKNKNWINLPF